MTTKRGNIVLHLINNNFDRSIETSKTKNPRTSAAANTLELYMYEFTITKYV